MPKLLEVTLHPSAIWQKSRSKIPTILSLSHFLLFSKAKKVSKKCLATNSNPIKGLDLFKGYSVIYLE